ncbi:MAG: hypothetical protein ACKVJF_02295 [Flavobacteriales bacterium]
MLPTLFTKKHKSALSESIPSKSKQSFYNIERLLTDLGIKFSKNDMSITVDLKKEKQAPTTTHANTLSSDLQQIAMNQMTYSKLMEERMQRSHIGKKTGKAISLRG